MLLNTTQIQQLVKIINRYHILFLSKQVGSDILSTDDRTILEESGINVEKLPKTGKIDEAFRFGMLADALGHKFAKGLDYKGFKKFLEGGKFLPLTATEKASLNSVKLQSYKDIKGLGNRISSDLTQVFIDIDKKQRAKFEKVIKQETLSAVELRKTVPELSSEIAHKTGDWARDFDRIADYLMHDAFTRGKAESIAKTYGQHSKVYIEVLKDACPKCKGLYMNTDGTPREFFLSILLKNGTNIGRPSKLWKPVFPPMHPWCRCELYPIPVGYDYDKTTGMYSKPKPYVSPVGRKSKIKIFIDGKEQKS